MKSAGGKGAARSPAPGSMHDRVTKGGAAMPVTITFHVSGYTVTVRIRKQKR